MTVASSIGQLRHGVHVARNRGTREFASRGLKRLQGFVDTPGIEVALRLEDVSRPLVPEVLNKRAGSEQLRVGFVMAPPSPASGGHRTLSRVIAGLVDAGIGVRVLLYDFYGDDVERHDAVVREFFPKASAASARDWAPGDLHAVFATSWETAQFVARSDIIGQRFYLVQDFEPWFHAKGTASELAEQTYQLGFHGIAIGEWLPKLLSERYGMTCDGFPFACDVSDYSLMGTSDRRGIAFYARPGTARRAYGLGMLALGLVHEARPDLELHLFGEHTGWSHFPVTEHGPLPPRRLNEVYNECVAGLALSMTNVSLVPWEMLAAGCIPVVNSMDETHSSLDNPFVRYEIATPEDLAAGLLDAVAEAPSLDLSRVAASVHELSWDDSVATVSRIVSHELGLVEA